MICGSCRSFAPTRFLRVAEKDPLSEVVEITHTETDPFQDLGFIVTAFDVSVRPRNIHRIKYLLMPVMIGLSTIMELWQIHHLNRKQPVSKSLFSLCGLVRDDLLVI